RHTRFDCDWSSDVCSSDLATGYALDKLQLRGELFVAPGEPVYEGMVVGESSRPGDMVVNVTREKQKTNIRTHASDEAIKLAPPQIGRASCRERVYDFVRAD